MPLTEVSLISQQTFVLSATTCRGSPSTLHSLQGKKRELSPKFLMTADCISLLPTAYTVPRAVTPVYVSKYTVLKLTHIKDMIHRHDSEWIRRKPLFLEVF